MEEFDLISLFEYGEEVFYIYEGDIRKGKIVRIRYIEDSRGKTSEYYINNYNLKITTDNIFKTLQDAKDAYIDRIKIMKVK